MNSSRSSRSWRALGALALALPLLAVGGSTRIVTTTVVIPPATLTSPLAGDLGAPGIVVNPKGKLDLWTRTSVGLAVHRGRATLGWTPNQSLGAPAMLYSAPFAASSSPGGVSAFVQGPYGEVYEKTADTPGLYSGWAFLGGQIGGRPAAASPAAGRFDVFGGARAGPLYTRSADVAGIRYGWTSLGGGLAPGSGPGAASTQGRTTVVIRGTDNAVWMRTRDTAGGYSAWSSLGGGTLTDPAVASSAPGRLDVFVTGTDHALWHRSVGSVTTAWHSFGGILTAGPSASAVPGGGPITVAGRLGSLGSYYTATLTPGGAWSGWRIVSHTGDVGTSPSWNPHVACKAVVTSLARILGRQTSPLGGATFDSGHLNPGLPDPDRVAVTPACSVDGQGVFVEVHGLVVAGGCGTQTDGDWTCTVYDPRSTAPLNLRSIHAETVGAWAASGWNPSHAPVKTRIDVQGFVWWDPTHTAESWHFYSGWEFHPFTAWRLSPP